MSYYHIYNFHLGKMYELNGQFFKKKSPALEYAKNYINGTIPYNQTIDLESDDGKFLLDLIAYHPNLDEKQGDGIIGFRKIKNEYGFGYSLQVIRVDETTEIFSYKACLNFNYDDLSIAMRVSIEPFRNKWRQANRHNYHCVLCGISDTLLEVDHKTIPFAEIKQRFLKQNKLPNPTYARAIACRWKFDEASSEYEKAWVNFHDGLVDYQFLCGPCNGKKSDKIDYIRNERNKDVKPYKKISTLYININDL